MSTEAKLNSHTPLEVCLVSGANTATTASVIIAGSQARDMRRFDAATLDIGERRLQLVVEHSEFRWPTGPSRLQLRDRVTGRARSQVQLFSGEQGVAIGNILRSLGIACDDHRVFQKVHPTIGFSGWPAELVHLAAREASVPFWIREDRVCLGPAPGSRGPATARILSDEAWLSPEGIWLTGTASGPVLAGDRVAVSPTTVDGFDIVEQAELRWTAGTMRFRGRLATPQPPKPAAPTGIALLRATTTKLEPFMVRVPDRSPEPARARLLGRLTNQGLDGERIRLVVGDPVLALIPNGAWVGEVDVVPLSAIVPSKATGTFASQFTFETRRLDAVIDQGDFQTTTTGGFDIHD